ncbi:transporter substrate-binding domain-containing protein [Oleiharenicola sp. Vm1]|uniref:transporter substrate-binding domain-containing protein n=1 Tax=Oleiharenicola sp. Vm1 TaxID=3398393 RepID=UPI0039F4FEC9
MPPVRRIAWLALFLSACLGARADIAVVPPAKRVGMLEDNYPFSFRAADGTMQGFAVELTQAIEQVMGLRFERVTGPTREVHAKFAARELDFLQSYARFPEREHDVDFSVPYVTMTGALFVREGDRRLQSLEDCRGRRVAVHHGSLGETILRRAQLEGSIYRVDSVEKSLLAVAHGEADATLVSRLSGLALAHHLGLKNLRVLEGEVPGYEVRYCYAVQAGDRELLAKLNEGLAILVRTGRFEEIYRKWFGHLEPAGYTALEVTMAVAVGLVIALLVALWAVWRLRRLQARLVRQSEEIRAVFDGAHDGLLVLDPAGAGISGCGASTPPACACSAWRSPRRRARRSRRCSGARRISPTGWRRRSRPGAGAASNTRRPMPPGGGASRSGRSAAPCWSRWATSASRCAPASSCSSRSSA